MTLLQQTDLKLILTMIYCFVDDWIKNAVNNIRYALTRPGKGLPPIKKHKLTIAELASLAIFRFFTGHRNWKDFYQHITTYHKKDFSELPKYKNFLASVNELSFLALILLEGFMNIFKKFTPISNPKFADSMKLQVCHIKREFSHKVCWGLAKKSKSSMGWFYGFKLHIICNELMQILNLKITAGNMDDRKGLAMIWNDIFGMIIADAGYVGKNWQAKAFSLNKCLLSAVKANMKKLMTKIEEYLLHLRQRVETVFSVLKLRFGIENTLPRSPLGYLAHYIWSVTAYQFKKFLEFVFAKPLSA